MTTLDFFAGFAAMGATGLVLVALAEKLIPIVPSYVLFVLLGMTVVADPPALAVAIVTTAIGSTAGGLCWYGLGRVFDAQRIESLVIRYGDRVFLSHSLYQRMIRAYVRNQFWVTLVGQLIPTARIYMSLPAGVLKLAAPGFLLATGIGALLWNASFLTLGFVLRNSGRDPVSIGFLLIAALVVVEAIVFFGLFSGLRPRLLRRRMLVRSTSGAEGWSSKVRRILRSLVRSSSDFARQRFRAAAGARTSDDNRG